MCNCKEHPELIDISSNYTTFNQSLDQLDAGDWVLLMQCKLCKQLYKVDVWDKLQTSYAIKIPSKENWKEFEAERLIKERIIKNRGGLLQSDCVWTNCNKKQVKSSAFCVNHIYSSGTRA